MPTFAFPVAPVVLTELLHSLLECSSTTPYGIQSFGNILNARLLFMPCRSTSELLRTL